MYTNTNKKINFFDLGLYDGATTLIFVDLLIKLGITNYNVYGFEACRIYYNFCERRRASLPEPEKFKFFNCAISNKDGFVELYYSQNAVGNSIFKTKNKKSPELLKGLVAWDQALGLVVIPEFLTLYPDLVANYLFSLGITLVSYDAQRHEGGHISLKTPLLEGFWVTHKPVEYENVQSILFSNWLKNNVSDLESSINVLKVNIEGAEIHLFEDLVNSGLIKHFDIICGPDDDVEKVPELSNRVKEYKDLLKDNNIIINRFSDWKPERNTDIKQLIKELL